MSRERITYFCLFDADGDPAELLVPENQVSTPWGAPDHGRCDKCHGSGACRYRCLSCLEAGQRLDCPACGGRVEFEDTCPACEGDGEITRTERAGVSVFPSLKGLYRYLVERRADLAGAVMVELDGPLSGDADLDADAGAVLICPTDVVARHPVDEQRVAELREGLGALRTPARKTRPSASRW